MFSQRMQIHKELDIFLEMINGFIQEKKNMIKNGVPNKELEDNERNLLDLMMESDEAGNGV